MLLSEQSQKGRKFIEGYLQVKKMLQEAQWLNFIEKFHNYGKEVTKLFARVLNGVEVKIGDIKFVLTDSFIAEAIRLPSFGEILFKNIGIEGDEWKFFFRNPSMDITILKRGIPSTTLKSQWRKLLLVIQKFITCEGRFGSMSFYHIHLIVHFLKGNEINLPYFLLNSLNKMFGNV